ncbi:MAG: tetratricopeptide (TPR) repeat protein [Candidatus Azotimanducaceae bacterium]|jgi:tetratricopeptide (TPR) repeat protein
MTDQAAQLKRAINLQLGGQLKAAEQIYRNILDQSPQSSDALHLLGLVLAESDDEKSGAELIQAAIKLKPDFAAFHHNLAGVLRRMGKLDEAETEFREAIRLKADYGEAYQGLAEMVKFKAGDSLLKQIQTQLIEPNLTISGASYLHFAMGKILDDTGDYSAAFQHYLRGNSAAGRKFSTDQFRQQTKDSLYHFGPRLVERLGASGVSSQQPIFVLGMPRSGTSLIEQILASHSSVFGAGELNDMKFIAHDAMRMTQQVKPYPNFLPNLTAQQLQSSAQRYLERTRQPNVKHVVDKHPLNFIFLGLILLMFPNAKVVHTVRDALDTCLSCFFQNFTKGQDYSFDLDTLAEFYLDYQRLMAHWHQMFPGRIFDVHYEQLLLDQEGETRRLLEFCDLSFEEGCLSFHETQRTVKTASFLQVRKPIYETSRGRWQNYAKELGALARRLGLDKTLPVQPVPPVTISTVGKRF